MMDEAHPGGRAVVLVHPGSGVFVGLHAHAATPDQQRFDETRIGLDHLTFAVADRASLEKWQQRLVEHGVDHSGIKDRDYGSILTFRDPDHLQLELYAPPAA